MKIQKFHFEFHSRFRNGIFVLSLILLGCLLGYYFFSNHYNSTYDTSAFVTYRQQVDSLKNSNKQKLQGAVWKLNPNFISDYKGYILGLSVDQLDRLYTYRKENRWIDSVEEFQKVTQVSDSLLFAVTPMFVFPKKRDNKKYTIKYSQKRNYKKTYAQKKDLNTVSKEELIEDIGIPGFIANRILKYRERLGGFVDDIQIKDVKGVYDFQQRKLLSMYTVKTPKEIKKININKASVKELAEIPYFDFTTALDIRDFIQKNGSISNFNELGKIDGFSLEKINRIELYLTLN